MTKRALVVGVSDRRPKFRLEPWPSLHVIGEVLGQLGGWTIERVEGLEADRDRMLGALLELERAVEPGDTVLFYFFGHGGVVRFTDGPAELQARPVFYSSAARRAEQREMTGVLDFEISQILHRVDRVCGNVTAILDCCHSARIVRGKIREEPAPRWVHELQVPSASDRQGTGDDHPRIVRLAATSALHFAFARAKDTGRLGLLTEGFAAVVREAGPAWESLTWDTVMHRVREHAIQTRGYEEQWVTLAGPRNRLLFSREEIELPRTVGFVADHEDGRGWLRAGLLQGVNVGDEWGLAALTLDAERKPQILARVRVTESELNRARVEFVTSAEVARFANARFANARFANARFANARFANGSSAILQRAQERYPIAVEGAAEALRERLDATPLLRVAPADEPTRLASVRVEATTPAPTWTLRREADGLTPMPFGDEALAVSLLEDWGRSQLLLDALERCAWPSSRLPVAIAWNLYESNRVVELPLEGAELREGQKVFFGLSHAGITPDTWYACAVELDVAGRPILLDSSEPEGREIQPRQTLYLGRLHRRDPDGFVLRWPEVIPTDRPRPVTVVFLMSSRPIELGHVVRATPWPSVGGHRVGPRIRTAGQPSRPPELGSKWAWARVTYLLTPSAWRASRRG